MDEEQEQQGREMLGNLIGQLDDLLSHMQDETLLDEEKLAAKRLFVELRGQLDLARFSIDFMNPEVRDSMKEGWTRMRDMALATPDMETFVKMANDMLAVIAQDEAGYPMEMKDEVEVPQLRKMLTSARTSISHVESARWAIETFSKMDNVEEYRHYIERQTMEMTHNRDYMLKMEAAIVRALEKKGERVPKWRNRPTL